MKLLKKLFGGLIIGLLNGMFGAGGGIVAVPLLRMGGINDKAAHASSVAVILPITVLSATLYLWQGRVRISAALPYLLWGVIGAVVGTYILSKISRLWLHRVFGALIIYAGIRLIIK